MMPVRIKRSWTVYFFYAVFVTVTIVMTINSDHERSTLEWIIRIAAFLVVLSGFIRILITTDYVRIDEKNIVIFKDYFKKDSFPRVLLRSIELGEHPFRRNYFVLKDGRKIPFHYDHMSRGQFEKLKGTLNVPVV